MASPAVGFGCAMMLFLLQGSWCQAMDGWIKMNHYDKLVDDCIQFYIGNIMGNIPFKYLGTKIDRLTACWEDIRQSVICPTNLFTSTYFGVV